jgi:hypothetical protein
VAVDVYLLTDFGEIVLRFEWVGTASLSTQLEDESEHMIGDAEDPFIVPHGILAFCAHQPYF